MVGAGVVTAMTPPEPVTVKASPGGVAPTTFDIPIEAEEAAGASVKVTLAIKPLGMTLLFTPLSIHMYELDIGEQEMVFPTLVAIPATAVFMAVIEDVG